MPRHRLALAAAGIVATIGVALSLRSLSPAASGEPPTDPMKQPAVEAIFATARAVGARAALDSLAAVIDRDPTLAPIGHQVAHGVGRYLVALEGYSPVLLASCRPTFQAGCYHGVLEEHLAREPDGLDPGRMPDLCPEDGAWVPMVTLECAHGLGHGVFTGLGGQLGAALERCDAMKDEILVRECQDGVIMARNMAAAESRAAPHHRTGEASGSHHVRADSTHDGSVEGGCAGIEPRHRPACWAYEPAAILSRARVSADSIASVCSGLEVELSEECWRGVGRLWTTWKGTAGARAVTEVCDRHGPSASSTCLRGVIEALVDRDWSGARAAEFCDSAPPARAAACVEMMQERLVLTMNK